MARALGPGGVPIAVLFGGLLVSAAASAQPASLDARSMERFARLALACAHQEYPNKIAHVMQGDADAKPPRELTPAFYGCYDGHSSVHGHWLLARLARLHPDARTRPTRARLWPGRSRPRTSPARWRDYAGKGRVSFERPYLEGTIGDGEAEVEEKLILGQRHGDWKWAFNIVHATEWEEDFEETEGELEADFGLTRILSPRWAVGLEVRGQSHIPDYKEFEDFALYVGPVVSYRRDKWWVALTVMPQVYDANYDGNPDGNTNLDLVGHERMNTRLLFGFSF